MTIRANNLAGVVLAAGGSSRLGEPKQLLRWRDVTLVEYAADICSAVCGHGVVAVTGASAADVRAQLARMAGRVASVDNPDWAAGLASSIHCGVQYWSRAEIAGILLIPCDQPLLTIADLETLVDVWQTDPTLPAVAAYDDAIGIPAIVPVGQLPQLLDLQGDRGAQQLLLAARRHVVAMPNAAFDVDTRQDLERLRKIK